MIIFLPRPDLNALISSVSLCTHPSHTQLCRTAQTHWEKIPLHLTVTIIYSTYSPLLLWTGLISHLRLLTSPCPLSLHSLGHRFHASALLRHLVWFHPPPRGIKNNCQLTAPRSWPHSPDLTSTFRKLWPVICLALAWCCHVHGYQKTSEGTFFSAWSCTLCPSSQH